MGLAQGKALQRPIRAARDELVHLEAFRLQQPWWLPYCVYAWLAERKASSFLTQPLKQRHPSSLERLLGISKGSSMRLRTLLLFNALESALSSLGDYTVSVGGCSTVAVRGSRSSTGEPVIATNFDYLPQIQPYYILRESQPQDGFSSLEFTIAPLVGAVDGVNEAGLCITYNYAFTKDGPPEPAVPISVLIAETLHRCSTVDEAAAWITSRPRWGGGLLMLADETGEIASLELSSTADCLRRPSPGDDFLYHTNCFFTDSMQEVQLPRDTVYTQRAPAPLRGRRLHESAELRDQRFAELLGRPNAFGPDELAALMSDHGSDGIPDDNSLCVHGSYWDTTATLQLLPKSRRLRVAYSTTCKARYHDVDLSTVARPDDA